MSSRRETKTRDPARPPLRFVGMRRLPHFWLFAIVNLGYCLPVLAAYGLSFSEGGVAQVLDLATADVIRFTAVYVAAILAFFAGAALVWHFPLRASSRRLNHVGYAEFRNGAPAGLRVMIVLLSAAVVASKILLIPTGVYSEYIFDGDLSAGPIWTASTFLSESLIIFILGFMVAEQSIASPYFIGAVLCLSLNLLHGTRIFDVVTLFGVIVYFWMKVGISRRFLIFTLLGVLGTFGVLYLAFANRTTYHYSDDANVLTILASPVAYEAVFSQMSLLGFLQLNEMTITGHPLDFLLDTISWVTPRIFNPDKDSAGLLGKYSDLAPLGAFSGHASGLIYFGYSLFLYYFFIGAFGSWLQRKAKKNPISFIIYIYFCTDILFRMMRDGLIYPIKYLSNSVMLLILGIYFFEHLKAGARRRPAEEPPRAISS